MAKTVNAYVPDQGEVAITLSAANITAIAAFTTAQRIVLSGVVRSFRRTNNPELSMEEVRVTGDIEPIVVVGRTMPAEQWELIIVDDESLGEAGEWGTDALAAVEIFHELLGAREHPTSMDVTPAGPETGAIMYTLADTKIRAAGIPEANADGTRPNEITIMIAASGHAKSAHA